MLQGNSKVQAKMSFKHIRTLEMLFPVFVMLELKVKNVLKEYLSHARNHVALMEQKYALQCTDSKK